VSARARSAARPVFRLVPIEELRDHEEVEPHKVDELVRDLERRKVVAEPIWVAAGSCIILNGHHRVAALRRLGAERVPAWVLDYTSPDVRLERWGEGPPIPKAEVERRANEGRLFPPKTTRHVIVHGLEDRSTLLTELMDPADGPPGRTHPRASRSPRRRAAASETT
jgi:L-serine kinase (ADP)